MATVGRIARVGGQSQRWNSASTPPRRNSPRNPRIMMRRYGRVACKVGSAAFMIRTLKTHAIKTCAANAKALLALGDSPAPIIAQNARMSIRGAMRTAARRYKDNRLRQSQGRGRRGGGGR